MRETTDFRASPKLIESVFSGGDGNEEEAIFRGAEHRILKEAEAGVPVKAGYETPITWFALEFPFNVTHTTIAIAQLNRGKAVPFSANG
jgi:hypothetical protein